MDINNVDTKWNVGKECSCSKVEKKERKTLSNLTLMKCAFNELIKSLL